MACNSDHLEPSQTEQHLSQVFCLLGELDGRPFTRDEWRGFHPDVYNMRRWDLSTKTAELCAQLQGIDVSVYSLEMQLWWRDHQEADRRRLAKEMREHANEATREAALQKLTPYERELLGL